MSFARIAVLITLLAGAATAQTTFGVIRGRVLDSSGAIMPNVTVKVTNTATNIARTVASNEAGIYEAGYLQPGTYSVSAEQPGFKKFMSQSIDLDPDATVLMNIALDVGELSSSVTVGALAALITTESAVISDVKTQQQYLQIPINQRGSWDTYVFYYLSTVPGVQPGANYYSQLFAGTRSNDGEYLMDGITLAKVGGGVMGPPAPSMEEIMEVKSDLSGNPAEFALPSQITVVTRGGGNKLHGGVFFYYNTSGLNARDFFSNNVPFMLLRDYGASISGPVIKNKTFYSGVFEGFNQRSDSQLNMNLASAAMRGGDFSQLQNSTGNLLTIKDPLTGVPFPGNVIPTSRLNATALKIQSVFFPVPNYGASSSTVGNFRGIVKGYQRREQVDFRVDHQLSSKNALFTRVTMLRMPSYGAAGLPALGLTVQRRENRNGVISDTHTFRPNLLNEFRFGLTRDYNPRGLDPNGGFGTAMVQELGLTNFPANLPNIPAVTQLTISGYQGLTHLAYDIPAYMVYQGSDNLSWIRGRHTMKVGTEIRYYYSAKYPASGSGVDPSQAVPNPYGTLGFTGQFTGNGYADFVMGLPYSSIMSTSGYVRDHRTSSIWAGFVQDEFKASPRLTVNFGVRYEVETPATEKQGRLSNFNPVTGQLVVPTQASIAFLDSLFVARKLVPIVTAQQAGLPATLVHTDMNNFAPRVGFAYKLTADNKTVVRAAYGIFYDLYVGLMSGGGPYAGFASAPPNAIVNGQPIWQLPSMFPGTPSVAQPSTAGLSGTDPNVRMPYIQQWNLTLERELGSMGLRVSYMGTKAIKLVQTLNVNQLWPSTVPFNVARRAFPQLSSVSYDYNGGSAFYNGLLLVANRKFKSGLQYEASYAWAHNDTDEASASGAVFQNVFDRHDQWGNDSYTRRQRFTATILYNLPFDKSHLVAGNKLLRHLTESWMVSAFVLLQTGPHFTPSYSGIDPANIGASSSRPDCVGNPNLSNRTRLDWYNVAAFAAPPLNSGRFGNCGVNVLLGPGTVSSDLGLSKRFTIRENIRMQIEGTFTNIMNHPNFGNPGATVNTASAGIITSTQGNEGAGARTVRLGVRLDF